MAVYEWSTTCSSPRQTTCLKSILTSKHFGSQQLSDETDANTHRDGQSKYLTDICTSCTSCHVLGLKLRSRYGEHQLVTVSGLSAIPGLPSPFISSTGCLAGARHHFLWEAKHHAVRCPTVSIRPDQRPRATIARHGSNAWRRNAPPARQLTRNR